MKKDCHQIHADSAALRFLFFGLCLRVNAVLRPFFLFRLCSEFLRLFLLLRFLSEGSQNSPLYSSSALLPTLWVCALRNGYCPLLASFHLGCSIVLLSMCGLPEDSDVFFSLFPVMACFSPSDKSIILST